MPAEPLALASVIVTTRNSARSLECCLFSVRRQTYPKLELIVVDNDSIDATVDIARRHADRVTSTGPERSAQRNRGAEIATGRFLLFIDSDMVLDAGVLAEGVEAVERTGMPAAIIPETTVGHGFWTHCRMLERSCYSGDDEIEAARLFTRAAFVDAGGFDLALLGGEDWDLSRRVAKGRRLPRTRAIIRHDEGRTRLRSVFTKRRYYAPGYLLYLRKHGRQAVPQGNPVLRPAYLRNWRELSRHPLLTAGFLSLKLVEIAAVLQVVVEQRTLGRSPARGRQVYG